MPAKYNVCNSPSIMPVSITEEKKTIVNNILIAIVATGFTLTGITVVRDIDVGLGWTNIIINVSIFTFFAVFLFVGKSVHYSIKGWLIIGAFLFLGVKLLLMNGLAGGTFNFFLLSVMITLLIIGRKVAMYVMLGVSLIYFTLTTLFALEMLKPVVDANNINLTVRWIGEGCSFLFVLFIVFGGIGRLQQSFINTIAQLNESNQKLNQSNEELVNQLEQIKQMETKVAESEINFKRVFEESNDGIIICNDEGEIIECNQAIATMLDYPKSFVIGKSASDFVIAEDKRLIDQLSIDKIHTAKIRELHLVSKGGARVPVEINYSVVIIKEQKAILVTIRDIRERKQTEQKVLNAVIQAEENERSRFATDLHDDLGPILSSIKMYIQSLRTHEDSEDKKELVNRLIFTVDDSIKSIRRISYNLSSHLLQNMGLINAIQTHADRINFANTTRVFFKHNFELNHRLASNIEIVVYRVLLELINNSIKHSHGTEINVELNLSPDQLVIHYGDNGIGFDIDKMLHDNSKGIGLRNILSRIRSIQGLLNFETHKSGFHLTIDINL